MQDRMEHPIARLGGRLTTRNESRLRAWRDRRRHEVSCMGGAYTWPFMAPTPLSRVGGRLLALLARPLDLIGRTVDHYRETEAATGTGRFRRPTATDVRDGLVMTVLVGAVFYGLRAAERQADKAGD